MEGNCFSSSCRANCGDINAAVNVLKLTKDKMWSCKCKNKKEVKLLAYCLYDVDVLVDRKCPIFEQRIAKLCSHQLIHDSPRVKVEKTSKTQHGD